jgi:formylglycine-generating enzyme required for sulfatase activity
MSHTSVSARRHLFSIFKKLTAILILLAAACDPVSAQTNNNFASRSVITSAGGIVSGNNFNASKETGEPNQAGNQGGKSVWWTWTPAASGTAEISTEGSDFDTLLGVYTGSSVSALTQRASNDDEGSGTTSRVSLRVTAGTAYQIVVDGFDGDSGSINLTVIPPIVVTNYTIALSPSPVAEGMVSGGGMYASGTSATVTATAAAGYAFVNWEENGTTVSVSESFTFTVTGNRTLVANFMRPPSNDNFTNRVVIGSAGGAVSGSNVGATKETEEPNHYWQEGGTRSVWWTWTPAASGEVEISTEGSSFDTVVAVYTGSLVGGLTQRTSIRNDLGARGSSWGLLNVTAGTVYHIAVDGFRGDSGNISLSLVWHNDDFASRRVIASRGGSERGRNIFASKMWGEPNHAGNQGGGSVWWTWTPATSGTAEISTEGSDFDTLLGVYTGSSVRALTQQASNDDGGSGTTSRVSLSVTAGTAYHIVVDGFDGDRGSITLNVIPPIVVPNYIIALSPLPGSGGTVNGGGTYPNGTNATVTATPALDYAFVNWTENGAQVNNSANYTFTATGNRTLVANFMYSLENDKFANRVIIESEGGTVRGNNRITDTETGEPNHAGQAGGRSVWWTWTPATSGTAEISTEGSDFNTLLGVYTGSSVRALTERASNDNGGRDYTSRVSLSVTAGTAYHIVVDGWRGNRGSITLNVTPPMVGTNYTIALSPLPGSGGTVNGGGTYPNGTNATVTATPALGYAFVNWTENGAQVNNLANYTFTVTGNRTLVANFTVEPPGSNTYGIKKLDLGRGELTFTEVSGALAYRVEWSATMAPGSWSGEAPGVSSIQPIGSGDRTVRIGIIQPPCFYRVVAEMVPPVQQDFALIPGGSFQMGDAFDEGGWIYTERPIHTVSVSAFFLQVRETTKAEWDLVRKWALTNGYTFDSSGSGKAADHPVFDVSWYDVVKWCNARSQKEGLTPCYYANSARTQVYKTGEVDVTSDQVLWTADGYRLPTEAEWEKAARGGLAGKRFPWGDTITHSLANYNSGYSSDERFDTSPTKGNHPLYAFGSFENEYVYTSPVGSFGPNGYGLYDMTGNVQEWCWDWHGRTYYTSGANTDPKGPTGPTADVLARITRGGSFSGAAFEGRVAERDSDIPSTRGAGFRPARGR